MSNRCPDCMKFVSLNQEDPDSYDDFSIDAEGEITGEVTLKLTCGECGSDMKEATLEFAETPDEIDEHLDAATKKAVDSLEPEVHTLSIASTDLQSTDRYEGKGRYARHFYGASATLDIECSCGQFWTVTLADDVQASAFDDQN